ncbi:MAG: hypothetical protein LBK58_10270 [Prevotellaceae bacterium]|jgi:hypothetical protein|nr:hypothetical protein [Prevotellaceae bacterium]
MNLHLRFIWPLEEYQLFLKIFGMMMTGRQHDRLKHQLVADFISFCKKMMEGSGVVSDRPGEEIFIDFECTTSEYEAAVFVFKHGAQFYSKLSDNSNENTDNAILSALIAKRLGNSIILPDIEVLEETENGIFLKDLDKGNISITNSAELVCRIFAHNKRIFYEDTENQWTELVHDKGVFLRFAPVDDISSLKVQSY